MRRKQFDVTSEYAESLDAADKLAGYRERFVISDPELIYLDGNSLGRLPKATITQQSEAVRQQWGERLIRGWNDGWYDAPRRIGDRIGSLIGAAPGQVAVADSTSVNLFKAVLAGLRLRPGRKRIVTDSINFPTDLYVVQGAAELLGGEHEIVRVPSEHDEGTPDLDELVRAIDGDTAVVTLSHVTFKNGFLYDMEAITELAHGQGAIVVWDLSHSVGAVPMLLDEWGVDFAVGCTYKYLNSGPGAPAFIYVNRALHGSARSPIWGWFGRKNPFAFALDYEPAPGITRFLAGTPPMLSLLAVESGIAPTLEAGMSKIRGKSVAQTEYLIDLVDAVLASDGFTVATPRVPESRGSHVALRHSEGYRIARSLIEDMKVIPDFREPDIIRFGCAPLYTTFREIWEAVDRTRRVVTDHLYEKYSDERSEVT